MKDNERVDVKCTLSAEDFAKVVELAGRLEVSPTRMASMLLRAGLQDDEVIIRIVTSDVAKRVKAGLSALVGKVNRRKRAAKS